jgi:uncharacterized protein
MYQKKEVIIILLTVIVLSFISTGEISARRGNGMDVDAIYQSIKDSENLYLSDENIVTFENEGMTLVCSLTIPRMRQKAPIVITLNGFTGNRNDMDIPGTDEAFYRRVARILAEHGFASLRVDFRGSGDSDGEFQMTTFSTQISDAIAAIDYIENNLRHQVNTQSIGIMGFSQGGLVGACTAGRDRRVDSLVLWSAPAHAPHIYEGLLTKEGIQHGLALPDGGYDMFGLYINGQYLGADIPLGKEFFKDLFIVDGITELRNYKKPMMYIAGVQDMIVWPQPVVGETFIKYHEGEEKLVVLEAGHNYLGENNQGKLNDAIYWTTAWFICTLKNK